MVNYFEFLTTTWQSYPLLPSSNRKKEADTKRTSQYHRLVENVAAQHKEERWLNWGRNTVSFQFH